MRLSAIITICLTLMLTLPAFPQSKKEVRPAPKAGIAEIGDAIVRMFGSQSCASHVSREYGYPMVAVACERDYGAVDRSKLLDLIFSAQLKVQKETWRLNRNDEGLYLYKLSGAGGSWFLKLYFRRARALWPEKPLGDPQVLIVVDNLHSLEDLLAWQTIALPLSYSLNPFFEESEAVAGKLREYKLPFVVRIPLEHSGRTNAASEIPPAVLLISDALQSDTLSRYMKETLSSAEGAMGMTHEQGDVFTANVFAMRALLGALRNRKLNVYIDSATTKTSVAFDTAAIMGFVSYKRDVTLSGKTREEILKQLDAAVTLASGKGRVILFVDAGDVLVRKALATYPVRNLKFIQIQPNLK